MTHKSKRMSGTFRVLGADLTARQICLATGMEYSTLKARVTRGWTGDDLVRAVENVRLGDEGDPWSMPISEHPEAQAYIAQSASQGGMSQVEIAAIMGVSRQAVEQIEARAIRKLAKHRAEMRDALEALRDAEDRRSRANDARFC